MFISEIRLAVSWRSDFEAVERTQDKVVSTLRLAYSGVD